MKDYTPVPTSSVDLNDADLEEAGVTYPRHHRAPPAPSTTWSWASRNRLLALAGVLTLLVLSGAVHGVNRRRQRWEEKHALGALNATAVVVKPTPLVLDKQDEGYLGICLAVKGQTFDLPEWLRHHYYHVGVKNFYIFDDGTKPPIMDQLTDAELGIPRGAITYTYITEETRRNWRFPQLAIYNECMQRFGRYHGWLALLDADELLEMTDHTLAIQPFLRSLESIKNEKNESIGALGVQWITHNSNGVTEKPERGLMRRSFTSCEADPAEGGTQDNLHVKVIVRPDSVMWANTPHDVQLHPGFYTSGEDGNELPDPKWWQNPPRRNKITLHHYAVKSLQEYREKLARGNAMADDPKGMEFWDHVEGSPKMECGSLAEYWP
ncbi:hypothetical protein MNV49_005394 [Pseudohyphozyma bogoriensis]|nr:hypothetical protein MNV49_005394 [Pseudohyphozyma bogoriensis]